MVKTFFQTPPGEEKDITTHTHTQNNNNRQTNKHANKQTRKQTNKHRTIQDILIGTLSSLFRAKTATVIACVHLYGGTCVVNSYCPVTNQLPLPDCQS